MMIKSHQLAFLIFMRKLNLSLLFIFVVTQIMAQQNKSWQASPKTIEKMSKSSPDFNYSENKVSTYTLPEVLTTQKRSENRPKKSVGETSSPRAS